MPGTVALAFGEDLLAGFVEFEDAVSLAEGEVIHVDVVHWLGSFFVFLSAGELSAVVDEGLGEEVSLLGAKEGGVVLLDVCVDDADEFGGIASGLLAGSLEFFGGEGGDGFGWHTEGVAGGGEAEVFGCGGGDDAEVEVGLAEGGGVGEFGEFGCGVVVEGDRVVCERGDVDCAECFGSCEYGAIEFHVFFRCSPPKCEPRFAFGACIMVS